MITFAWFLLVFTFPGAFNGFLIWINPKSEQMSPLSAFTYLVHMIIFSICVGIIWGGLRLW